MNRFVQLLSPLIIYSSFQVIGLVNSIDHLSDHKNHLLDFRYNSARIDAITKLPNDTLIVVSNGYYWVLREGQLPRSYNVRGKVSDLHPLFQRIDAIFTDPSYNEFDPKIFIMEYSYENGLLIACQEYNGQFKTDNQYCNLPVDERWHNALRDLNLKRPIDAAVWRNRSKEREGGFWTFFQGTKFSVVDPFKMELRFTYDIEWMNITDVITAAFYDYKKQKFYLFHHHNLFHVWHVNTTLMKSLPMGWDRAFLHGTLSKNLAINKDFFEFSQSELYDYDQPNLIENKFVVIEEEEQKLNTKSSMIVTEETNDLFQQSHINSNKNQGNHFLEKNIKEININMVSDEGLVDSESNGSLNNANLILLLGAILIYVICISKSLI